MPIIQVAHVSKRFRLQVDRPRSFQELVINRFKKSPLPISEKQFWALRDVSFAVERGETLGIIGANGSGKSTCLKLLTRILVPTSGTIDVQGRISALLELGAGFHPELTGRENIFMNGAVLGLPRREMSHRVNDIVEFAELERFIDIPVKFYSSGMYVRLAFAIAINVSPDTLLIDEVLAVGDQSFQDKCLERILALKNRGVTIIFVSHGLDAVRNLCDRTIWLDGGILREDGVTDMVVGRYLQHVHEKDEAEAMAQREVGRAARAAAVQEIAAKHEVEPAAEAAPTCSTAPSDEQAAAPNEAVEAQATSAEGATAAESATAAAESASSADPVPESINTDPMAPYQRRWGSREAEICDVAFRDAAGRDRLALTTGEPMTVVVRYRAQQRIEHPMFGLAIHRADGLHISGPNNILGKFDIPYILGEGEVHYTIDALPLLEGTYYLTAAIYDTTGDHAYDHHALMFKFKVYNGEIEERYGALYIPAHWEHLPATSGAPVSKPASSSVASKEVEA